MWEGPRRCGDVCCGGGEGRGESGEGRGCGCVLWMCTVGIGGVVWYNMVRYNVNVVCTLPPRIRV